MAWRAQFEDGPLADAEPPVELHFGVFPVKRRLYMARLAGRWVRVGDEHLVPTSAWPEQVEYRAHEDAATVAANGDICIPYRQNSATSGENAERPL